MSGLHVRWRPLLSFLDPRLLVLHIGYSDWTRNCSSAQLPAGFTDGRNVGCQTQADRVADHPPAADGSAEDDRRRTRPSSERHRLDRPSDRATISVGPARSPSSTADQLPAASAAVSRRASAADRRRIAASSSPDGRSFHEDFNVGCRI